MCVCAAPVPLLLRAPPSPPLSLFLSGPVPGRCALKTPPPGLPTCFSLTEPLFQTPILFFLSHDLDKLGSSVWHEKGAAIRLIRFLFFRLRFFSWWFFLGISCRLALSILAVLVARTLAHRLACIPPEHAQQSVRPKHHSNDFTRFQLFATRQHFRSSLFPFFLEHHYHLSLADLHRRRRCASHSLRPLIQTHQTNLHAHPSSSPAVIELRTIRQFLDCLSS